MHLKLHTRGHVARVTVGGCSAEELPCALVQRVGMHAYGRLASTDLYPNPKSNREKSSRPYRTRTDMPFEPRCSSTGHAGLRTVGDERSQVRGAGLLWGLIIGGLSSSVINLHP